jgi:hypothetical protein
MVQALVVNFQISQPVKAQCYKKLHPQFTNVRNKLECVHYKPFQPRVMLVRETGACPSGAPKRSFPLG